MITTWFDDSEAANEEKVAKSRPKLRFNIEKLTDPQAADLFEATIACRFAALNLLEENIDSLTENIHGELINTASEVFGKARRKKKPWMTFWI